MERPPCQQHVEKKAKVTEHIICVDGLSFYSLTDLETMQKSYFYKNPCEGRLIFILAWYQIRFSMYSMH